MRWFPFVGDQVGTGCPTRGHWRVAAVLFFFNYLVHMHVRHGVLRTILLRLHRIDATVVTVVSPIDSSLSILVALESRARTRFDSRLYSSTSIP